MIAELIKMETDLNYKTGLEVNNVGYTRKSTIIPFKANIIARNNIVCNMEGRQSKETYDITTSFSNNYYKISFWEQASNVGTISSIAGMVGTMIKEKSFDALQDTMLPKIYDANGNQVGKMEYMTVKGELLQSYAYYKLSLRDIELNCYVVGHGREEIFFVMYDREDRIVATVSKRMTVKHAKSRYTLYVENDEWFEPAAISTIILQQMLYDAMEEDKGGYGTRTHALNTHQKELLDKYDPNFIDSIISREDPSNLPENMPLVEEKVKESLTTFRIKLNAIVSTIFIVGFIILILLCIF